MKSFIERMFPASSAANDAPKPNRAQRRAQAQEDARRTRRATRAFQRGAGRAPAEKDIAARARKARQKGELDD